MRRIRIGKDIAVTWTVTTNGESIPLNKDNVTIEMSVGSKTFRIGTFDISGNTVSFGLRGTSMNDLGTYTLTLWYNKGKEGQTAVDAVDAFKLVKYSTEESDV